MRNGFLVFTAFTFISLIAVLAAHPPSPRMADVLAVVAATPNVATPLPTALPVQAQVGLADFGDSHLHAGSLTDGTTAAAPSVALVTAAVTTDNGDVENVRCVFQKFQACHTLEPGKTLVGPSLAKLIGRHAGLLEGFDYSDAMKKASIVWGAATPDAYLADPQKVVPGNHIPFLGLKSETDRHDVVALLAAARQRHMLIPAASPLAAVVEMGQHPQKSLS